MSIAVPFEETAILSAFFKACPPSFPYIMFWFMHFLGWFCLTDWQEIQSLQSLWIYAFFHKTF